MLAWRIWIPIESFSCSFLIKKNREQADIESTNELLIGLLTEEKLTILNASRFVKSDLDNIHMCTMRVRSKMHRFFDIYLKLEQLTCNDREKDKSQCSIEVLGDITYNGTLTIFLLILYITRTTHSIVPKTYRF